MPAPYETSGSGAFRVSWSLGDGSRLTVLANLSDATWKGFGPSPGRVVWSEGDLDQKGKASGPWSVIWSIADAANAQDVVRP